MQRYLFYLIKYKYYLHIYEDSFGAKILRDDCALSSIVAKSNAAAPQ